jgi:hypothetical protein
MPIKIKSIENTVPVWLFKLVKGSKVFGVKKDKLFLEIFDMGGLHLIEDECNLSLNPNDADPNTLLSLKKLIEIKCCLIKERKEALESILKSDIKVSLIKAKYNAGGGVLSAIIAGNKKLNKTSSQ